MSERHRTTPFELDPASVEPARIELVEETDANLPVVPEPAPRPPGRVWRRLLLGAGGAAVLGVLGLEAYDFLETTFVRSELLGGLFAALFGLTILGAAGLTARELNGFRRLARADALRRDAAAMVGSHVHGQAEPLIERLERLYAGRPGTDEATRRFRAEASDALNDGERLRLFATTVLGPIDRQAYRMVRTGARDIGALTALSPLGLLDGLIVLARTLSMLRAIATLYGVRPGAAATVSLLRRSIRNALAAGVADLVGDAAVETAGASLLSMLSARAGQGVVNGLLVARLGLGAMQLCRPVPFTEDEIPSMRQLRTELFGRGEVSPRDPSAAAPGR